MTDAENTDIILVINIYSFHSNQKQDYIELVQSVLSNPSNRIALITFDTESRILTNFTNDENLLINLIEEISSTVFRGTTYYRPLVDIDTILKDYQQEDGKDVIALFVCNFSPSIDVPSHIGQYRYLKNQYPYLRIHAIQYRSNFYVSALKDISDNQFLIEDGLASEVLQEASIVSDSYDSFQIIDYIDDDYFTLESEDDITVSHGEVRLEEESGLQKITWTIPNYRSGSNAHLTMNLKLKEEYVDVAGSYSTNVEERVISSINGINESISSLKTPVLSNTYEVIYDGNAPEGCSVENVLITDMNFVYDTVSISEEKPSCNGYQFKGWEIISDGVTKVNDDYFVMPESDVIIRAKWSKLSISKSMNGEVYMGPPLYSLIEEQAVMDNISSTYVSSSSGINFGQISSDTNGKGVYTRAGTENDLYPIYYYRGDVDNNHVLFADYCWLIVRTTDTGGVKLIYDGVPGSDGSCSNTGDSSLIGTSVFNNTTNSPADVGYMYGTRYPSSSVVMNELSSQYGVFGNDVTWDGEKYTLVDTSRIYLDWWDEEQLTSRAGKHYSCLADSSTCSEVYYLYQYNSGGNYVVECILLQNGKDIEDAKKEMFTNTNDSVIKDYIDTWYQTSLINYSNYLEDTVWCNDRNITGGGLLGKDSNPGIYASYFAPRDRLYLSRVPDITCSDNDSFTVNSENGNGALTYPIGLLTSDEAMLAGGSSSDNNNYYLYTGSDWYLSSPYFYGSGNRAVIMSFGSSGVMSVDDSNTVNGVRPSLSLRHDVIVQSGDGSSMLPYEIFID